MRLITRNSLDKPDRSMWMNQITVKKIDKLFKVDKSVLDVLTLNSGLWKSVSASCRMALICCSNVLSRKLLLKWVHPVTLRALHTINEFDTHIIPSSIIDMVSKNKTTERSRFMLKRIRKSYDLFSECVLSTIYSANCSLYFIQNSKNLSEEIYYVMDNLVKYTGYMVAAKQMTELIPDTDEKLEDTFKKDDEISKTCVDKSYAMCISDLITALK